MMDLLNVYNKARKVVESCTNANQIPAARNYVNLFLISFGEKKKSKKGIVRSFEANSVVGAMYEELLKELKKVEKKFVN